MKPQNSLIVIPARGGSVGIRNKNLQFVQGLTLIQRTFHHARFLSDEKMPICISTDSAEILNSLSAKFNLNIDTTSLSVNSLTKCGPVFVHFRGEEKAASSTLITENLFDLLHLFKAQGISIEGVALMQPTSPYRNRVELNQIREFIVGVANENSSFVSVTRVEDCHPARMYKLTRGNRVKPIKGFKNDYHKRRQDLVPIYIRDGGIYVIGAKLIQNQLQYLKNPTVYVRHLPWSINIDSEIDLLHAQNVAPEQIVQDPSN